MNIMNEHKLIFAEKLQLCVLTVVRRLKITFFSIQQQAELDIYLHADIDSV